MYQIILFTDHADNIFGTLTIGAYKCAHSLRKAGYSCLVINHYEDYSIDDFKQVFEKILSKETILMGFSTTFVKFKDQVIFSKGKQFENEFIELIKSFNPAIKILIGGAKATNQCSNKNIDYVCLGYSEISIVNLANHISKNKTLTKSYKNVFGCVVIDDRLATEYNFKFEDMIWTQTDVVNHRVLPIEIGRGCIFKCKFCSYPLNGKKTLDFVKDCLILEQELVSNYNNFGITHYIIVDDTFNDHIEKLETIRRIIKKLPFQPIFWAYTRLDLLCTKPESLEILHDIGIRAMYFGIETLNLKTGRIIGKGYNRLKQIEKINYIRHRFPDISLHGSFIVGLPHESMNSVTNTFNALVNQNIPLHSWIFHPLSIHNINKTNYDSDINLNYTQYGYTDLGTPANETFRNWQNEFMNYHTAKTMVDEFMMQSRKLPVFKLEGFSSMQLSTYGLNFDSLRNIAWKEFDFHNIETVEKPKFIKNYKSELLKKI